MGPPPYMRSVVDRNVVLQRMTISGSCDLFRRKLRISHSEYLKINLVKYGVLALAKTKISVYVEVVTNNLIIMCQRRFGITCCLHLQGTTQSRLIKQDISVKEVNAFHSQFLPTKSSCLNKTDNARMT